jgi:hypothetical protein
MYKMLFLVFLLVGCGAINDKLVKEPRMTLDRLIITERSDGMVQEVRKEFVIVPGWNFWEDAGEVVWKITKKQLGL